MSEQYPLVVVLGLSPTGLYSIRELSRAGFPVLGVSGGRGCAATSKFLTHPDRSWRISDGIELVGKLIAAGSKETLRPILLPTSDRYIEFIADHYVELAEVFTLQKSYSPDYVFNLLEKGLFYKLCAEHGIPAPGIWYPETQAELCDLADVLPFPCILKPKLIHLAVTFLKGKKVLLVKNREEYLLIIKSLPDDLGGWVIQEVIPGPESNILLLAGYFDCNSDPIEIFTARKLRQYPPGFGSASLVQSETNLEILESSIGFLKKIGFQGVCGTEFKSDPRDGKLKIIEINPRPTLWFQLSHASGKRVVETACRDFAGLPFEMSSPQVDGVLWRYALKDISSKLFYLLKGKGFVFPSPEIPVKLGRNGRTWAVYDQDDTSPIYAEPLNYLRKFFARM
jgi:D-aspartate ligase